MLKISEAASLALHTMVLLEINSGKLLTNKDIASEFNVSEAHLSKVLQRLVRFGFVKSVRGPKGGYMLGKAANLITLLDVYKSIEGPISSDSCLFGNSGCFLNRCILGDLVGIVNTMVKDYLAKTRLSELAVLCGKSEVEYNA
jgi:Rrf2 family protein